MAARSGCPTGLAGGSAGGGCLSIHLSVLGDAMVLAGSANPTRSRWVRGAGSWLLLAVPQQIWPCTMPGPPWLGLGLPVFAWALLSAAGPRNCTRCLFPCLEAGKRCRRAPAEMDEV